MLLEKDQQRYMAYNDDGLLDIVIGLVILFACATWLTELYWMVGTLAFVFFLVWQSAKQIITAPRVRGMQFTPEKARQLEGFWRGMIVFLTITMVMGLIFFAIAVLAGPWVRQTGSELPAWINWFSENVAILLGLTASLFLGLLAYFGGLPRFYGYALLTLAIVAGSYLLDISALFFVALLGAIMLLVGLGLLVQFMRAHPPQPA
jgi:hypothetical protein